MTLLLGVVLNVALWIKPYFDRLEDAIDPLSVQLEYIHWAEVGSARHESRRLGVFLRRRPLARRYVANTLCLALGFGQVMVLLAVAASLATRLPMVVNLVMCLLLFFLGHLSDPLVEVTERLRQTAGSPRTSRTSSRSWWT